MISPDDAARQFRYLKLGPDASRLAADATLDAVRLWLVRGDGRVSTASILDYLKARMTPDDFAAFCQRSATRTTAKARRRANGRGPTAGEVAMQDFFREASLLRSRRRIPPPPAG